MNKTLLISLLLTACGSAGTKVHSTVCQATDAAGTGLTLNFAFDDIESICEIEGDNENTGSEINCGVTNIDGGFVSYSASKDFTYIPVSGPQVNGVFICEQVKGSIAELMK